MMDIKTERGQQTLLDEYQAAHILEHWFPTHRYIVTPKDLPAKVDAVIVKDGEVVGVVETKCRYDMTLEQFHNQRNSDWMISASKVFWGQQCAEILAVKFVGFLYLVKDKVLLFKPIADHKGRLIGDISFEERVTQSTVNGGQKFDRVALINMKDAQELR